MTPRQEGCGVQTEERRSWDNPIWTMIAWSVIFLGIGALFLIAASRKTVVIAEGVEEGKRLAELQVREEIPLTLLSDVQNGKLYVPLPAGSRADQIYVENQYLKRELHVHLRGVDPSYYAVHPVYGDLSHTQTSHAYRTEEELVLILRMDAVLEYRTVMNGGTLEIEQQIPSEAYQLLVVLDPEEEISYQVASYVAQYLNGDVRIYLNSVDDDRLGDEEMERFVRDSGADLYLRIGTTQSEDPSEYGISAEIGTLYFLPEYGNAQLADAIVRGTAISTVNRGRGVTQAPEESILWKMEIPSARVSVGYSSNAKEAELLAMEEYRKELSQGIAAGIAEAGTAMRQ